MYRERLELEKWAWNRRDVRIKMVESARVRKGSNSEIFVASATGPRDLNFSRPQAVSTDYDERGVYMRGHSW